MSQGLLGWQGDFGPQFRRLIPPIRVLAKEAEHLPGRGSVRVASRLRHTQDRSPTLEFDRGVTGWICRGAICQTRQNPETPGVGQPMSLTA